MSDVIAIYPITPSSAMGELPDEWCCDLSWLAYGVYRKSRVAATALFAYHLLNRMAMYRLTGELGTMLGVAPLVYAVIFFLGIVGTFSYDRDTTVNRGQVNV